MYWYQLLAIFAAGFTTLYYGHAMVSPRYAMPNGLQLFLWLLTIVAVIAAFVGIR